VGEESSLASNVNCGCESCPCPQYISPEERKAAKLAELVAKERAEREHEKAELHEQLSKHQANLAKINAMARALRFQYTQLRRHHNVLRTHISANKEAFQELGGDDEYKGTDLDIESRPPPLYETLDDIPNVGSITVDAKGQQKILKEVESAQAREKQILANLHKATSASTRAIVGEDSVPAKF